MTEPSQPNSGQTPLPLRFPAVGQFPVEVVSIDSMNVSALNYPRFCSYVFARAGFGWLAGCEVPVRAASYSAGGT